MSRPVEFFHEHGYYIARGLFSPQEVEALRAHYMRLNEENRRSEALAKRAADPGKHVPLEGPPDPLHQYPRMLQMHRWDETSLRFLLDSRLRELLTLLLGGEPYAVQTMIYFKPPGARGQALHQDQYYLRVQPGTSMAAWLALDDCDESNGCMQVVDGSHKWDILCTVPADTTQSFSAVTVPLPAGVKPTPAIMQAGDVLFFNGSVVHGSFPNTTKDRFRRSLIAHYIVAEAQKVGEFYQPVLRMDGSVVDLGTSEGATQCGIWVDHEGEPVIEMVSKGSIAAPAHE